MSDAPPSLLDVLACPVCRAPLGEAGDALACPGCGGTYPRLPHGILDLRPPGAQEKPEARDWTRHWSQDNQGTASQRFFSAYRKAVFARSIAHFANRHFPARGLFLEAGSGTSETSGRIDKRGGQRRLVALDIVVPVLAHCDPAMDVRMGGDIFRLPFRDESLDGLWNVGVMEHFTPAQIDQLLREFHRVLKEGAPIILFWPGTSSAPQRVLRVLEWFINLRRDGERFRFHPDEISQLRSSAQGRQILARNGFELIRADEGPRTLLAFKTLVAVRRATVAARPGLALSSGAAA